MADPESKIEFTQALAKVCFEHGVRRAKIGEVEVEMACVKNLNFEERPAPAPAQAGPEQPRRALPRDLADWEDALGGDVPYVRRRE